MAKRLMQHAEKFKQLAEKQHRGRYGRTAGDATVLAALTTEIFHLQRSNTTITDFNAKACYDRILLQLVSLEAYKLGLPYNRYGKSVQRNKSATKTKNMDKDKELQMLQQHG
eukprot:7848119-Ditylum_brightwellii.AAC.1